MTELTFTECSTPKQPECTINSYSVYLTAWVVPERANYWRARAVTGRATPPTKGRGEGARPEEASERNQRERPHQRWSEQHPTKATPKRSTRAALTLGRRSSNEAHPHENQQKQAKARCARMLLRTERQDSTEYEPLPPPPLIAHFDTKCAIHRCKRLYVSHLIQ